MFCCCAKFSIACASAREVTSLFFG